MAAVRQRDIRESKADFIFGDCEMLIDKERYQLYTLVDKKGESISFWGIKGLNYPPEDFHVSNMDILLKRRVINKNR